VRTVAWGCAWPLRTRRQCVPELRRQPVPFSVQPCKSRRVGSVRRRRVTKLVGPRAFTLVAEQIRDVAAMVHQMPDSPRDRGAGIPSDRLNAASFGRPSSTGAAAGRAVTPFSPRDGARHLNRQAPEMQSNCQTARAFNSRCGQVDNDGRTLPPNRRATDPGRSRDQYRAPQVAEVSRRFRVRHRSNQIPSIVA
jgi:hypothetical protein